MEEWRRILAESIVKPKDLADRFGLDEQEIEAIVGPYPMRITPTVLGTIKEKGDAIWKQVVPDPAELDGHRCRRRSARRRPDEPCPAPGSPLPGSRPAHGHQSMPDLLPLLHPKASGGQTRVSQKGRTGPRHRLSAGTYGGSRCDSLGRGPSAASGPSPRADLEGAADHPSSGIDPARLTRARHPAGTHYPEAVRASSRSIIPFI